ncbi:MAG TPA: nuclear transport factor 2 family protein [Herpetosiphonaceae bacterium]|nr:nuclear transport factor 2 family protein [Herpetosiphonaceae bacterium]
MALQHAADLREAFLRFYQAFERGDADLALGLMSREEGVLSIGTDPDEWWTDSATLERVYRAQFGEMRDAGIKLQPGDLQCYTEGNVGWCADRARIILPNGTEQPVRLTGVFRREGGEWKMVQSHASIGVRNQETIGTDLTT